MNIEQRLERRPYGMYLLGGAVVGLLTYDAFVMWVIDRGDLTISVQFLEAARKEPILAAAAGALLFHLCGGAVKATKHVQATIQGEKAYVRELEATAKSGENRTIHR